MDNIVYDCRWSDEVDDSFIEDFIATENAVFHGNYTTEQFKRKYIDNIYGKSVVEVVYLDGVEQSRKVVSTKVVKQPTNRVIVVGTKEINPNASAG